MIKSIPSAEIVSHWGESKTKLAVDIFLNNCSLVSSEKGGYPHNKI